MSAAPRSVALALTGASGMAYGLRLLECLLGARIRVALVYSQAAQIVAKQELDLALPARPQDAAALLAERYRAAPGLLQVYGRDDWYAPMASGSSAPDAMVICPCSMGTVAAVAHGTSRSLIERSADVALKERRPLILVPRETPLSLVHLRNLTLATEAGALILPAAPGFYHRPERVSDLVDFIVQRIVDHLGLEIQLAPRWGG